MFLAAKGGDLGTFSRLAKQDPALVAERVTELPAAPLVEVIADLALAPLLVTGLLWDHGKETEEYCIRGLEALEPETAARALIEGRERLATLWSFVHAHELLTGIPCEPTTRYMLAWVQAVVDGEECPDSPFLRPAVEYLGKQKVAEAKGLLLALLKQDQQPPTLKVAITALVTLQATEAVPRLEALRVEKWPKYLEKQIAGAVKKLTFLSNISDVRDKSILGD